LLRLRQDNIQLKDVNRKNSVMHAAFTGLALATQNMRRAIIENFRAVYGGRADRVGLRRMLRV
jgi:hypothetical protein